MSYRVIVIIVLSFFSILKTYAQDLSPKIEIGPSRVYLDEEIKITITIYGNKYDVADFPDIAGFLRGQKSLRHSEEIINGKKVPYHVYTQTYKPIVAGDFLIPSLDIEVNGELVRNTPIKIWVETDEETYEVEDVKESAVLLTQIKDSQIFVGEGLPIKVSFYLANNTTNWEFPSNISEQIEQIARKIKPENSLESRNVISEISQRTEYIKGVKYNVYDLFETVYYPLSAEKIVIPVLELKMLREGATEILKSKSKTIQVKELPEHPLREKVPVGKYRLKEYIEGETSKSTGESFVYRIVIEGSGFVNVVNINKNTNLQGIDFYEAGVTLDQQEGKNRGTKSFTYKVLPKSAGEYSFKDYFSLIYFNTEVGRFDTLYSKTKIKVTGEEISSSENALNDIYAGIEQIDTSVKEFELRKILKHLANIILVMMAILLTYIRRR